MSFPSLHDLLDCAVSAARAAGNHAAANGARRRDTIATSRHDVKLELDVECQVRAQEAILARYPDHAILGEEDASVGMEKRPEAPAEWIVDPIDGTVNFSHGFPFWCSSVAVRAGGNILAGAVYAPDLDELYTATEQTPAAFNGKSLSVSDTTALSEAIICTGLDKNAHPDLPPFALLNAIATRARKARVFGSAALDICRVASGQADGYFESGIYVWDMAAASLIVRQSGGVSEVLREHSDTRLAFAATNGGIHEELKALVFEVLSQVEA